MPEPIEESIAVAPSEDNGNVPAEAPSEPATPETPAEPVVEPAPAEPELFELPDGRKVDASTLSKEWKDNFYPDYTRKSQELATKQPKPDAPLQPTNPLLDPEYVPQTYAELAERIEAQTLAKIEAKERAGIEARQNLETEVANQLQAVKTLDPAVNENALFLHATKYGFRDLKLAHQNMKDMSEMAKKVQNTTVANIAKRNDPVSVSPGATGAKLDPDAFASAKDYLRALKGTG